MTLIEFLKRIHFFFLSQRQRIQETQGKNVTCNIFIFW